MANRLSLSPSVCLCDLSLSWVANSTRTTRARTRDALHPTRSAQELCMREKDSLLEVAGLIVDFASGWRRPPVRAVAGVSLTVSAQETVALVGESGSGKTTIGRAILGLAPITDGKVLFAGEDIM